MSDTELSLAGHEVAAWLRRHPLFLKQYPDLALSLVVPRDEGPAASLVGYQLEILREKNRELSRRLQELSANAQVNEQLSVRVHQLTLALMRQRTAADTLKAMVATLSEDFDGDEVTIVLFHDLGAAPSRWLRVLPRDSVEMQCFSDIIRSEEPVCGRMAAERNMTLYGQAADRIQSSAVIPLDNVGLLAVGSTDPNRFYPGMGTVFLRMMSQSLLTALSRFS